MGSTNCFTENLNFISQHLSNLDKILMNLIESDIISEEESQLVNCETTEASRNTKLLSIIADKEWSQVKNVFLNILRATSNEYCADRIAGISKTEVKCTKKPSLTSEVKFTKKPSLTSEVKCTKKPSLTSEVNILQENNSPVRNKSNHDANDTPATNLKNVVYISGIGIFVLLFISVIVVYWLILINKTGKNENDEENIIGNENSSTAGIHIANLSKIRTQYEQKTSPVSPVIVISLVWPNGIIPYTFDPGFVDKGKKLFLQTVAKISSKTCIRFQERNSTDINWVILTHAHGNNEGCKSYIGRIRSLKTGQPLILSQDICLTPSTFELKMGQVMGLPREEARVDRDEYITWDNTLHTCPKDSVQVNVFNALDRAALDIFYDYVSLMHGEKECLTPNLPGPITIGASGPGHEVNTYSVLDYEKLNTIYDCGGCQGYRFVRITNLAYKHHPIEAGQDLDEKVFYICRNYHQGSILVGKSKIDGKAECFIGAEGKEHEMHSDFEVLTNPKGSNFTWVKRPKDFSIPSNAVIGGRTVFRDPIYIGRCLLQLMDQQLWTPGTLYNGNKELNVPFAGGERSCTDYEILVCNP